MGIDRYLADRRKNLTDLGNANKRSRPASSYKPKAAPKRNRSAQRHNNRMSISQRKRRQRARRRRSR